MKVKYFLFLIFILAQGINSCKKAESGKEKETSVGRVKMAVSASGRNRIKLSWIV